jgi:hypothetical protein
MNKWKSRSTLFAAFFAVTSFILALKSLLTGQYVAMVGAVQAILVARAVAEDQHERLSAKKKDENPNSSA